MARRPEDLVNAASAGRLDIVRELLATQSVNRLDWRGCALSAAIENGHNEVVTYLLSRGANPGVAVNAAATTGSVEMVQTLLNHGASVGDRDYEGRTPLHYASERGHLEVVELLLANGAGVTETDMSEKTPLHLACRNGESDVVSALIRRGAKVNAKDRLGNTSLHRACEGGNIAVVKELINHKGNIRMKNILGMIPLHCACEAGRMEVVAFLMASGNYSRKHLSKALLLATEEGFHEIVEILLSKGAEVQNRETPLFLACFNDKPNVVSVLLKYGADVNERRPCDGATPLHIACNAGNVTTVQWLLQHGADVLKKDDASRVPLHYVRSEAVLRALLQRPVDVNAKDEKGNTALIYAAESCPELFSRLLDYEAGAGLLCRKMGCLREKTGMMCFYMYSRHNVKCDCRITGGECFDSVSHKHLRMVDGFEKYFIRLKTAELNVNENEKAVDPPNERVDWSEFQRSAYTTLCQLELETMKTLYINNTRITYFDLLTRSLFDLQDEAILGNFSLNECLEVCPVYGDMIHNRCLEFRKRFLREHSRTFFGLTEPWLPLECAEKIIDYLPNQDLDNLVYIIHT